MHFNIQEPESGRLLDRINAISDKAQSGVGVFAFASKSGINALINSPNIQKLLATGRFTLIVGVDALTNVEAIETLVDLTEKYAGRLESHVFFDCNGRGIFHPKFCWFKKENNIHVLAGSGNLTSAGLGAVMNGSNYAFNWEAFGDFSLSGSDAIKYEEEWSDWIRAQSEANRLRSLRDHDVLAKAMQNSRFRWQGKAPLPSNQKEPESPEALEEVVATANESVPVVFISEIPKNTTKGRIQANFQKIVFERFFGFEARAEQGVEVLIQHVAPSNEVGEVEVRHLGETQSSNFRIELGAGKGATYTTTPQDDRPLVIFVRINTLAFRYCLLMPGDYGYHDVLAIWGPSEVRGSRPMRRTFMSIEELKRQWIAAPSALLPSDEELPEV